MVTLKELAAKAFEINRLHNRQTVNPEDWEQPFVLPAMAAYVHSEISEAFDGFVDDNRTAFIGGLTDAIICCLSLLHGMGVDPDVTVNAKLELLCNQGPQLRRKRL